MSHAGATREGKSIGCAGPWGDPGERLKLGVAILELIDRRRLDTGAHGLGQNVERMVVDRELADLAQRQL